MSDVPAIDPVDVLFVDIENRLYRARVHMRKGNVLLAVACIREIETMAGALSIALKNRVTENDAQK